MRVAEILANISEHRKLRQADENIDKLTEVSKGIFSKIGLTFSNEAILEQIIPYIVSYEVEITRSKQKPKSIKELMGILKEKFPTLSSPTFVIESQERQLRKWDGLARLLCPTEDVSACVAVCAYQKDLLISSNTSRTKSNDALTEILSSRMKIIRDFLLAVTQEAKPLSKDEMSEFTGVKFSDIAKLLAKQVVLKLMMIEFGGFTSPLPTTVSHRTHKSAAEHFEVALLKLAQFCLEGIYTNGMNGFDKDTLAALLTPGNVKFIMPDIDKLAGENLHAEQAIIYYLRHYTNFCTLASMEADKKIPIGISKLCCQTCHYVLTKHGNIQFRGSHGMLFPNVHVMMGKEAFVPVVTSFIGDPYPGDSDSEIEFDKGEEDEEEIPTLDTTLMLSLLAKSTDKIAEDAEKSVSAEKTPDIKASEKAQSAPPSSSSHSEEEPSKLAI